MLLVGVGPLGPAVLEEGETMGMVMGSSEVGDLVVGEEREEEVVVVEGMIEEGVRRLRTSCK